MHVYNDILPDENHLLLVVGLKKNKVILYNNNSWLYNSSLVKGKQEICFENKPPWTWIDNKGHAGLLQKQVTYFMLLIFDQRVVSHKKNSI